MQKDRPWDARFIERMQGGPSRPATPTAAAGTLVLAYLLLALLFFAAGLAKGSTWDLVAGAGWLLVAVAWRRRAR